MFGQIVARRRLLVWARMQSRSREEVIQTCGEGRSSGHFLLLLQIYFIFLWTMMDEMQYLSGAAQSKLKIELV